jgi:ABC-2 type transport system permease protein
VAIWEIPLVFTLQLLTILLVAWIGGRIYRVGLLMTGKRPTLPELIRWIRHG